MTDKPPDVSLALGQSRSLSVSSKLAGRALQLLDGESWVAVAEQLIIEGKEAGWISAERLADRFPGLDSSSLEMLEDAFIEMGIEIVRPVDIAWAECCVLIGLIEKDADWPMSERKKQQYLMEALGDLSTREMRVVDMLHGLLDGRNWTDDEAASTLGLTPAGVRRIEVRSIQKLRAWVVDRVFTFSFLDQVSDPVEP